MDQEARDRRRSLRLLISEAIMVLAVIITVIVLALIVSGYWLNTNLEVERRGMLQISSVPSGATVTVDDSEWSWLERTNVSKVISVGEHTIKLTKDGYDSWSRTINVTEGLLYRIHYPRLFLEKRESTPVYDLSNYTFGTVSPDGNYLLLANNTTSWLLLNLENDKLEPKSLDISKLFTSVSVASGAETGLFTGEILAADWSRDNNHLLFHVQGPTSDEWVILNPRDLKNSVNLSNELKIDLKNVQIFDNSASNLLALVDGNLHKIDVPARQLSPVIAENVLSYDHYGSEVVFTGKDAVYIVNVNESEATPFLLTDSAPKVVISQFYDDKYITVLAENAVTLYKKDNFERKLAFELTFAPETIKVGHDGEFIEMTSGVNFATLDMEAENVREWTIDSPHYGWLDRDMLFSTSDGALIVYDFDGLNRRVLASAASSHFPAAITSDKWLYYISDGELTRTTIRE